MRTVFLLALSAASAFAASPSGRWQCLIPAFDHSLRPLVFHLKTTDTTVTGVVKGEIYDGVALPDSAITDGSLDGTRILFYARIPVHGGVRLTRYTGTLADDSTMDLTIVGTSARRPPVTCTAKRVGD